jgi:UDP-N-acetyl-D-galactosamine dehydrogenase
MDSGKNSRHMIDINSRLQNRTTKIAVVGLGYVGLPIAVAFGKKVEVIGYDIDDEKIKLYQEGVDPTREVGDEVVSNTTAEFTTDERRLREAKFVIIAVPTPVSEDKIPDLTILKQATQTVGRNLTSGSIVVFESTVYPGVTEDICIPILENTSKMECGVDFKVGYSPERINPGDELHRLDTITKVVAGMDEESLDIIAGVYELVVHAGVYRAESIKVAEASKVIENAQRDINIAFMNELAIIFNKMGIDTKSVLKAAGTKWNFLDFKPGLVGGHCIGIDPYYLAYKAKKLGYCPEVILSGRRVNDGMGKYVAHQLIKSLIGADIRLSEAKVAILGFTFKENCPDTRNTRVVDIVEELASFGIEPLICDPVADSQEVEKEYGLSLESLEQIKDLDAIVLAVSHDSFRKMSFEQIVSMYGNLAERKKLFFDVKAIYNRNDLEKQGFVYWSL